MNESEAMLAQIELQDVMGSTPSPIVANPVNSDDRGTGISGDALVAAAPSMNTVQPGKKNNQPAVAYLRTACDGDGTSMAAQRDQLARFATERGLDVVATFEDPGVSAHCAPGKRKGFMAMLAYCKRNRVDVVVAMAPDRISRRHDALHSWLERFAQRKLHIVFASDPALLANLSPADVTFFRAIQTMLDGCRGCRLPRRRPVVRPQSAVPVAVTDGKVC